MDANFARVAAALQKSQNAVFLTGAGISVASGISPYRKSADAVWENFIMEWGTAARFHKNPLAWYREFWIKAHPTLKGDTDKVRPNPGHDAISQILQQKSGFGVITQNIDGLHKKSGVPADRLIEIHGRHDVFVCSNERCSMGKTGISAFDLRAIDDGDVPECDVCGSPIRPMVLLFDEMYESQPFFRAREARRWLNDADVVVFCGTSFSVGITAMAVNAARYSQALMVNVNVAPVDDALGMVDVLGKSEELLPALAKAVLG